MAKRKINKKHIFIVLLFALAIFSLRYGWFHYFGHSQKVKVENGEVLITGNEKLDDQLQLVGEWAFYPKELIDRLPENKGENPSYLQVPGGWSSAFENDSTYGYGTYHLRIQIDDHEDMAYALRMYSVRSASKVIVNGKDVGGSGRVSSEKKTYEPFNIPYNTSTIRPDENGVIDVFVQVANFTDSRTGGIVRSVYFGPEKVIESKAYLSSMLQVFSGTIFVLQALFALIIYLIGIRHKEIMYYSLGLLMLGLFVLHSGDEKVVMQLIKMDYVFAYKFSIINIFLLAFAIIHISKERLQKVHPKIVAVSSVILIGMIVMLLWLPMDYLHHFDLITMVTILAAIILMVISLLHAWTLFDEHLGLVFAFVALSNHFAWFGYTLKEGMKVLYYPFDLIIAVISLSVVWFKHYYDMNVKIKLQADRLAEADKEKDLFLANTAHELKNPLHGILNISNAVLKRERHGLTKESEKDLEAVLSVSKRMTILVDDLLDMSKLERRKPTLYIRPTSLQGVVQGTIYMNTYLLARKDVEILNKLPPDFPRVLADENRLTQIMYNLVHNAVKFTEKGQIIIDAHIANGQARISVSDTGVGMEDEFLTDLFLPYSQGNASEQVNKAGGLGLGLYITKQLIEHMSGEVDVQSTVGEGTTFTFTLPVEDEGELAGNSAIFKNDQSNIVKELVPNEELSFERDELAHIPALVGGDKSSVMVVDDDPINLHVMEVVLPSEQYDVTTALSGIEAIELLEQKEYDLIITDVMMPHMSGYELTKNIRTRFTMSELPILLLTSRDRIHDVKYGFDLGANDYIAKPFDEIELMSRVGALTGVRNAARESLYLESAFLQAQIQPHFIFNTINSIMALSEIDLKRMQKLLEAFSDVLRSKFDFKDMKQFVELKQELQLIEAYLYIEQVRFGERVKIVWEIDKEYKNVQIPSITIQPLVENAILHGITTRADGGTVTIKVIDRENDVTIVVADDGVGIPKETLDRIHNLERVGQSGVGIYNTNMRLLRTYGQGLDIESKAGFGTKVSFSISKNEPYRR